MIDKMNNREIDGLNNDIFRDGIKGGVVGEKQGKDNHPKMRKGIAIGLGTLTVLTTAAGCTPVPSESAMPTNEPAETQPGTESPSQTNVQETPTATITFSPTGEVTVSPKPTETPEITNKPTKEPTAEPTDNPTVEPTETVSPNETEQNPPPTETTTTVEPTVSPEATTTPLSEYDQRKVEIYGPELIARGCKPELVPFCSRLLFTLDINNTYEGEIFIKSGKLTRDQIFDYGKNGETSSFTIEKLDDGSPAFIYVGCSPDVIKYSKQSIANWKVDAPNFLKSVVENGMCVFYQNKIHKDSGMDSYYDMNGLFTLNCSSADIKRLGKTETIFMIQKHLGAESYGIKAYMLGFSYKDSGYIKQDLAEVFSNYLYITTNKEIYKRLAKSYLDHKAYYNDNPQSQEEKSKQVMDENLVSSLNGMPWSEILAVVNGN